MLVEPGVDPHVTGAHLSFSKLLHLFDGAGCAVLETDSVQAFVQIDGVLAGHHFRHGGRTFLLVLRHPEKVGLRLLHFIRSKEILLYCCRYSQLSI